MPGKRKVPARGEAGFTMVEMLMAAFILSVGILGLTMLQLMSIRTASGGHNLGMAVQLADQVMDQVELEGRLTYLNANITSQTPSGALTGLTYINKTSVNQYFGLDPSTGNTKLLASSQGSLFSVNMTQTVVAGTGLSDVQVQVQFADTLSAATRTPIQRTVTISRRILHG